MKTQERKTGQRITHLILMKIFWLLPMAVAAQTPAITASFSDSTAQPHDTLTVTFAIDTAVDAYYFGVETVFDDQALEFIGERPAGLMSSGVSVADLLSSGRVGASVTLTSSLAAPDSGDLLKLDFRIKQAAPIGPSQVSFENIELNNSEGALITTTGPPGGEFTVEEAVSDLRLMIPAVNIITEGEELQVTGSVYVNDITVNESIESDRVTVWVGIHTADSDPSGWSESAWSKMAFDVAGDSIHKYITNIGFGMDPGSYYLALRAQLDTDSYVYGGRSDRGGGLWDGTDNVNAGLTIEEQPLFRHILAGWDFDNEDLSVSRAVPVNDSLSIYLVEADLDGYSSGNSGRAVNSDGWQFTEGDEKYWLTALSTEGFKNIRVSSRQYGTSAGPRDFELEASLDSLFWEVVSSDTIKMASNWTSGVVDNLLLPSGYNNSQKIYLRWIRRGDFRVDGTPGITTGNNRMDDLFIRGENINATDVYVWPGDCDRSGVVDELDVFRIGQYWLSEGPTPVYNSISWAERKVESWIPGEAAFADANGDGMVNHRDLQPLGLHFGKSTSSSKQLVENRTTPLNTLELPRLKAGEKIKVFLRPQVPVELTGLSHRFRIVNIDPSEWKLQSLTPGGWAEEWKKANKILAFHKRDRHSEEVSATWVYKGAYTPDITDSLSVIEIEAVDNWKNKPVLILDRVVISDNKQQKELKSTFLVTENSDSGNAGETELPKQLQLNQNYPNPFNPRTVIRYALPGDGKVSIKVYDMLGREVATIFEGVQRAGRYQINYDAADLASGVYFYRLKTEQGVLSRRFTFIK